MSDTMTLQQGGKGSAGVASSLSDDQADQLAASFRPAWDVDGGDDDLPPAVPSVKVAPAPAVPVIAATSAAPAPAPAAPAAPAPGVAGAVSGAPARKVSPNQTMIGIAPPPANLLVDSSPAPAVQSAAPSATNASDVTQQIDAANILEVVAALPPDSAGKTLKLPAQKGTSTPPPAPKAAPKGSPKADASKKNGAKTEAPTSTKADASKPNSTRPTSPVAEQADPFRAKPVPAMATTELHALVPKRSNKGFIIGGVVVAAAVVIGLAMRSGSSDAPKPHTETAQRVIGPAPTTNDIPPPPEKDEPSGTPQVTQVTPSSPVAPSVPAATAAKLDAPSKPVATTAAAIPADHRETVTAPKSPEPTRVAAAPAPKPQAKAAAAPPSLPPASKPSQKSSSGGIVRDNPF